MQNFIAYTIAGLLGTVLVRSYFAQKRRKQAGAELLFSQVRDLLNTPIHSSGISLGSQRLDGFYKENAVQIQTVSDTLATRKLPCLWLMVTIPDKLPVTAKLDMMLRSAGPTSFSNFDFLRHSIGLPPGFPEHATLRSDHDSGYANLKIVKNHLEFFANPRAKELLITPDGLRLVIQIAEAERSRYVVMREANFSDVQIEAELVQNMIESLLALKAALEEHATS